MESGHVNTKYFTDLPQNDTIYREFFTSGNFGENNAWKVC